jgi:hypothetical protein
MLAGTPATSSPLRQLLLGPGGNRRRGGWLGLFGEREVDLTERRQLGISGFKPRCHPRDGKSLIHGLRFFSRRPKDQPTQGYSCGARWFRCEVGTTPPLKRSHTRGLGLLQNRISVLMLETPHVRERH